VTNANEPAGAARKSQIEDPMEQARKPNSVVGDHVSRPIVADRLEHPTRGLQMLEGELRMMNDESFNIQHSAFSI